MKKSRRILALAIAALMLLSLCACGREESFETRLKKATDEMNELQSQHLDMVMDLGMELTVMGKSQNLDMTMNYSIDTQKDPARARMEIEMSAMGTSQKILGYTETIDGQICVYLSMDGGKHWEKQSAETSGLQIPADTNEVTQLFVKNAEHFEKTGTETINGAAATVYSGVMGGEYVKELMASTGMGSALGESFGLDGMDNAFDDLGDIPMTIAIDDHSGRILRYTIDMTSMMEKLMKNILDATLNDQGLGGINLEIKISRCLFTATLSQFNSVPEIVIPGEARQT